MRSLLLFEEASNILYEDPFAENHFLGNEQSVVVEEKKILQEESTYLQKWGIEENQIYLEYLMRFPDDFKSQSQRRRSKIFKRLSDEMGGRRDPEQCRGHHKKMAKRLNTVPAIIEEIKIKIEKLRVKKQKKEQRDHRREIRLAKQGQKRQTVLEKGFEEGSRGQISLEEQFMAGSQEQDQNLLLNIGLDEVNYFY